VFSTARRPPDYKIIHDTLATKIIFFLPGAASTLFDLNKYFNAHVEGSVQARENGGGATDRKALAAFSCSRRGGFSGLIDDCSCGLKANLP
jgi:hypothetical protein